MQMERKEKILIKQHRIRTYYDISLCNFVNMINFHDIGSFSIRSQLVPVQYTEKRKSISHDLSLVLYLNALSIY
jgi:hypothetical protein